jgi:TPR repeat protein
MHGPASWSSLERCIRAATAPAMFARECYEMAAWLSRLIVAGVVLVMTRPAFADDPKFADLLARAEAQAAAGHRWAPSGDNMTETVGAMMKLISSATPEQLAELSNLLEGKAARLPRPATKSAPVSEPAAPATAAAEPDPSDEKSNMPPLDSEPDRPVEPAAPATRFQLDRPVERPPASAATLEPARPVERPPASAATLEPARPVERPRASATTSEPERAITRSSALVARLSSPRATDLFARGAQAERAGNVSGARRYYASAVQLGSATAARNLGRLYDPVFLKQTTLGGIDPDLGQARHWYELAVAMGDPDAAPLLEALASR